MPYYKRSEKCKNASGKSGSFVTIKKDGGKRQCWKNKAAFEKAQAARHAKGVAEIMNFTEEKLLQIILEEIQNLKEVGNYSAAAGTSIRAAQLSGNRDTPKNFFPLKPHRSETVPLDDKIIKAILSSTTNKKLNEDIQQRVRDLVNKLGGDAAAIKRVAQRLALPVALVASTVAGGLTGAYLAGSDSVDTGEEIELQVQDAEEEDVFRVKDIAGTYYDQEQFSGMTNQQKIDDAWSKYDISMEALDKAPVSSTVWIYKYKMIPVDQISPDTPLPLMGTTAGRYYKFLRDRAEANPMVELPLLKNQVYGDVGKWAGGIGGKGNFKKAADGSQILPPDWTVAYTVYADLMEERTKDLMDYYIDNPDDRQELYQMLGVQDRDEFNKFVQDTMYKIGRPMEVR